MPRTAAPKQLDTEQTYPGVCRGCKAEILWLRQRNNRMHPYNPDGTSHFATCPKADDFRRDKQARLFLMPFLLCAVFCACKTQRGADPQAVTITAKPPVVVRSVEGGSEIGYGFHFRSTITTEKYEITSADCGHALRFSSDKPIAVSLPLLPFPCALMLASIKAGPVNVTITQTAPDGSGGDFNGDRSFTLGQHQSAVMHVNQSASFYRGIYACRAGYCGTSAPPDPASGSVSSYSDLTDFKATVSSNKRLDVTPGAFAIGSYSFPAPAGGSVEFTGGSGDARVYMSRYGILTTEAAVGATGTVSGQMVFLTAATPGFPPGSIPICDLALDNGTYKVNACDLASRVRNTALEAGPGITVTYTQGVARISTDATVARTDAPGATSAEATTTKVVSWVALLIAIAALCLALYKRRQHAV